MAKIEKDHLHSATAGMLRRFAKGTRTEGHAAFRRTITSSAKPLAVRHELKRLTQSNCGNANQ
jgi:hypothetical protein